jgi:hypothetical protein
MAPNLADFQFYTITSRSISGIREAKFPKQNDSMGYQKPRFASTSQDYCTQPLECNLVDICRRKFEVGYPTTVVAGFALLLVMVF